MQINRHNYEAYFLMYTDNELSTLDKKAVEVFVQQNPDLALELQLLLDTKLAANTIPFSLKENLKKVEPEQITQLLSYLDNELDKEEAIIVEQQLASNTILNKEWKRLQQAKLAGDKIIFANKASLYKKDTGKLVSFKWWKAAAAILLVVIGLAIFFNNKKEIIDTPNEIVTTNKTEINDIDINNTNKQNNNTVSNKQNLNAPFVIKENKSVPKLVVNNTITIPVQDDKKILPPVINKTEIVNKDNNKPSNNLPVPPLQIFNKVESNQTNVVNVLPTKTDAQKLITTNAVSNSSPEKNNAIPTVALVQTDTDESNDNRFFYAKEETIKKSKLGGFLKKVKRIVERTANIKTGNSIKVANIEIASL